ncbi:MAG TPA: gephyrin-like molybdotransferase Glp [Dehalococcoidia bacterium]|nr:gephyrin-like molybdotransferase Glp [Dehalococcoidia bacterium]
MISVEEALERILSYVDRLDAEERPALDALGQALAEDVRADFDIPPYDNTAMDGYAVRAEDTRGASPAHPVSLRVVGELAAGYVFEGELPPGGAIRIMTGAPMPRGADAVVPFEETDEPEGHAFGKFAKAREVVGILKEAKPGANVRRAGEDVARGQVILRAGQTLHAAQVGVLASLGRATVRVVRRPVIAILSTGDEIVEPGQPLRPGQIYDANAYSIAAMTIECGAIPRLLGIARDTVDDLTGKVREGLAADMLVTSAGVSRGDYDVVKDVLAREGEVDFWTVRMKPGKPLAFGAFRAPDGRRVPHIGLPGNPVSSMVSFELFGRPAIFKMMGRTGWERPRVRAIAEERIVNTDGRRVFARVIVTRKDGRFHAALTGPQGSGILTSMAFANGLAVVPEDVPEVRPGDEVDVILLE